MADQPKEEDSQDTAVDNIAIKDPTETNIEVGRL